MLENNIDFSYACNRQYLAMYARSNNRFWKIRRNEYFQFYQPSDSVGLRLSCGNFRLDFN